MNPILFEESATNFTTNGIGRLSDALSCVCLEKRNGEYEISMEYPVTGAHYSDIGIRKIIVVKPSANATLQAFRVYNITRPINGKIKVYAQHITYDLSKNTVMPFSVTASSSACSTVLSNLKSKAVETCPFTFWTNVTTVASYNQTVPGSIRSRLGGVEGSVLDQYGGEYEWDNLTVKLHKQRGSTRDITLRYGKNITDVTQDENIANTVTGIVPYWSDVEGTTVVTLPEKAVYSSHASSYSSNMTVPVDFSEEFKEEPTVTALRAAANVMVNAEGFGIPKVSIDVSFVNLADSEEYKGLLPLQNVNLCDVITVQFEELGIDTTAEIIETEYDVLNEKYISIQVGDLKSTLASTITDIEKSGAQAISNAGKRIYAEVSTETQELVNNATAWLTSSGGYVVAVKNMDGSWKELLFLDTNDTRTAHNVLRINENGIGFSSNGVGGPYTQAWTLDGRLVVGGTNVPSITCYDSNNNILFQASADGVQVNKGNIILKDVNKNIVFQASSSGIIWNATNSSMAQDGTLTVNNGKFTTKGTYNGLERKVIVDSGKIEFYYSNERQASINSNGFGLTIYQEASGEDKDIMIRSVGRVEVETNKAFSVDATGAINLSNNNGGFHIESSQGASWTLNGKGGIDIFSNGVLAINGKSRIELNAPDIDLGGITRTFEYKNEDGNNSWIRFKNGILVDWG